MSLDLRIPMGLMFTLVGAILALFGATTNGDAIYRASLSVNLNLYWGIVLFAFGLTMFLLGQRSQRKLKDAPPDTADEGRSHFGH